MLKKFVMLVTVIALLGTIACGKVTVSKTSDESINSLQDKIVRGQSTDLPSFIKSSVVALRKNNGEVFCSGVLIKEDEILTARHCVDDKFAEDIFVAFGTSGLFPEEVIQGTGMLNLSDNGTDLATVKLKTRVYNSLGYKPAEIFKSSVRLEVGDSVVISGFGKNSNGDGKLYWGRTKFTEFYDELTYSNDLTYKSLLEFGGDTQANTCVGDSGAPVFMKRDGRWGVVGINSGSAAGCNEEAVRMVAADARANIDWILNGPKFDSELTDPNDSVSSEGYYTLEDLESFKFFQVIASGGLNCRKGPGTNFSVSHFYENGDEINFWWDWSETLPTVENDAKGRVWFITMKGCWAVSNYRYIGLNYDAL